jgi:hypothetical protein
MTEQKVENWAAIAGRWRLEKTEAAYQGPEALRPGRMANPFGICISDVTFSEGEARATVRLPAEAGTAAVSVATSAYLMLGYRAQNQEYFLIGLAGYDAAYTMSRYVPNQGWVSVAQAGSKTNLKPDHNYRITVRVQGQRVTLIVDGIRVLEHVLEAPIANAQLGLCGWGHDGVLFTNTSVSQENLGKIFVVMKFSDPYEELYRDVIQPVSEKFGLQAYHAGEVFGPGVILDDIVRGIIEAKIVIVEITPSNENENVFYELGYAHALGKPTILLAERAKELPFDVKGYRCLFYDNSIGGKRKVEEALEKHLEAMGFVRTNPKYA